MNSNLRVIEIQLGIKIIKETNLLCLLIAWLFSYMAFASTANTLRIDNRISTAFFLISSIEKERISIKQSQ